jgi:fused signal recognition particle receptor
MPSGIGLELIIVGALLVILGAAGIVAWRRGRPGTAEDRAAIDDGKTSIGVRAREDPRDRRGDVARIFEGDPSLSLSGRPAVLLIVGAAGSGRTTMVGKLGYRLINRGRLVAMTAVDPFGAHAVHPLASWAERSGADLLPLEGTTDPGTAAYEAVNAARARRSDVLLVDTTGDPRESMDELARIRRVLERATGKLDEVLLVVDVTAAPSAIAEARRLVDVVGVTGIALSNLDRTSEPAIAVVVREELGVSVKLVGAGEHIEALRSFDPAWFAKILDGSESEAAISLTRDSPPAASERPSSAAGS